MITIITDDIRELKDVCEALAYQVVHYKHINAYSISDEEIATILKCEGLEVEVE